MQARTIGAALAALVTIPHIAIAQDWPTRPITMVVPFAAGGQVDVLGRVLATRFGEILGQQVIVENVGGGGGMIGSNRVARATPDGYQFVLGSVSTHAQSQSLHKKPLYDVTTEFAPVALVAEAPLVLVTRKSLPVKNLKEFIAHTKANAAKMQYGGAGVGSATHLACVLLNLAIGVETTHVPYRGGGPAMQDLVGGRLDYLCNVITSTLPQIKGGTINAVATLARTRAAALPDLPTAHEQGLANFDANTWNALFMPAGAPPAIVKRLRDAADQALNTSVVQQRLAAIGVTAVAPERRTPDYLATFVRGEIEKWGRTAKAAGIYRSM